MNLLIGLLWACATFRADAASPEANVYIYPESAEPQSRTPSISPNDARLLFALRLRVSEYHSIGDAGESTLNILNAYEGPQRPLFGNEAGDESRRLLLVVEGVEHPEDITLDKPAFTIHDPPSSSANLQLIAGLLKQDEHRRDSRVLLYDIGPCKEEFGEKGSVRGGVNWGYRDKVKTSACGSDNLPIGESLDGYGKPTSALVDFLMDFGDQKYDQTSAIQSLALEDARRNQGDKEAYTTAIQELKDALDLVNGLCNINPGEPYFTATIVFMPPSSKSTKHTPSPYGTFTLPTHLSRRVQPQTEEPLSALNLPKPASSSASSHPSPPETLAASTSPVTGVLPVCHSTLKTASSATHNCSGHGTPYLKYQTKSSSGSDVMIDCWACKCGTTVTKDKEGRKKTVYWGGPACQKKDISVQFWMLAALGVGLAATISWGMGLLYSIGEEELPSVIGAGVAGPRAQK